MARYLLAMTVGPVQDFIAAARRTRDLWFGSHILSDISRAAASAIQEAKGELIFPHALNMNVANVILAEVDTENPGGLANNAKARARMKWREIAEEVLDDPGIRSSVDTVRWGRQVDDVVEFYAAWAPLFSDTEYQTQRRRVMRLLSGRKGCRDFVVSPEHAMRIKKSSLDGARETVLKPETKDAPLRSKLRLNPGEELDVVGLTKRHGYGSMNFPSLARIAADPWLFEFDRRYPEMASELRGKCRPPMTTPVGWKQFKHFPFEASPVYIERHRELLWEADSDPALARSLAGLNLRGVYQTAGQPSPYLAVLSADGDGMGKQIDSIQEPKGHREFSKRLSGFAKAARDIAANHYGALIYAGGDDVLALVPVDMALACAHSLHEAFKNALAGSATLSVGIGIGHFMEPFEDLLEYARDAETAAKAKGTSASGDGLAVHLHSRGGEPSRIRGRWSSGFYERLQSLAGLYAEDKLADKAGYDLEEVARKYDGLDADWLARALPGEAAFVLGRKQGAANALELRGLLQDATSAGTLHNMARELMVARRLGKSRRESGGRSPLSESTEVTA